jgi:signal transduction histidine kinase/CheY-like chemotaxis protein
MTKEGAALPIDTAQLVSMMFALLPVPVAITDHRGRVVLCNSCFTDIFQGIPVIPTIPLREVEVSDRGTFRVKTLPLTDDGYQIVFAEDVSEQVQMRKRVARLEKMAAVGRVVSGVTSELEAPLADIASYVLLVEREVLAPEVRQVLGTLLARAERASHLVQSLNAIGGTADTRRTLFDLNQIVCNVVDLRRHQQEELMDVVLDLDDTLPKGVGDPSLIEQVVLTLLMNAEDAITSEPERNGLIEIRTCIRNDRIQLHVTDNGPSRDTANIFEPVDGGVGLNISAEIAKDHGGDLFAWNAYGGGATLTFELPIHTEDADSVTSQLKDKAVLVVDAETYITELVSDALGRLGAIVQIANSGSEAYDRLKAEHHDLVICDRHMPGLSGQGLYRLSQDLETQAARRFLFLTADPVPADTRQFFSERGVHFLRKPFKVHDLLETIDRLFDSNP